MMHLGVEMVTEAVIDTVPTLDWLEIAMLLAICVVCALILVLFRGDSGS